MPLSEIPFDVLAAYDRQCFPAARDSFLRAWIGQAKAHAVGYQVNGELRGYALRRQCHEGHKIGPLFADTANMALQLLNAVQGGVAGQVMIIDMPEINTEAMAIAKDMAMEKVFATARMYQKERPSLADEKIFGISTFELG